MTKEPKLCCVCFHDMKRAKRTADGNFLICPKCKVLHYINGKDKNLVRCPTCYRLFANVMSYNDHLAQCNCNLKIINRKSVLIV